MIKLVNMRRYKLKDDEIMVRVDRGNEILGNPHYLHRESDRNMVCDLYDVRFEHRMKYDIEFISEIERIIQLVKSGYKVVLGCWCTPKRCHGDIILRIIKERLYEV